MSYTDSLTGSLYQSLLPGASGSAVSPVNGVYQSNMSSNALSISGITNYVVGHGGQVEADAERRQQTYLATSYGANTFGGGLTYSTGALGGLVSASANAHASHGDYTNGNAIGCSTTPPFRR